MDCIFCKIINKEIPSYKIYEDDTVYAFLDLNQEHCGHTLIVPKEHFQDIDDIPNDKLMYIFDIARKLKKELTEKLNCEGIALTQNNGFIQEVKHFHLHLLPYYKNNVQMTIEEVYDKLK